MLLSTSLINLWHDKCLGTVDMNCLRLFQGVCTHLLVELFLCSVKLGRQTSSLNHVTQLVALANFFFLPEHNNTLSWIAEKDKKNKQPCYFHFAHCSFFLTLLNCRYINESEFSETRGDIKQICACWMHITMIFWPGCVVISCLRGLTFSNILHCDCPLCVCVTNESWQIRLQLEIK